MEWYRILNADEIDSPALMVYPQRVIHNIRHAIKLVTDVTKLRPHIKTHKSTEVLNLFRREGIHKVKCSGIAEVAIAAQAGLRYILLAYPVVGPKCSRHVKIVLAYPSAIISCLVDNVDSATALSAIANENNVTISVFIEVNVEQGRTEVAPGGFCDLWMACKELKGIRPVGIHTYDGHNHDADLDSRRRIADGIHKMILNLPEEISEKTTVVLRGSPSFPVYAPYKDIQVSPGTFVYWDKSYSEITRSNALNMQLLFYAGSFQL